MALNARRLPQDERKHARQGEGPRGYGFLITDEDWEGA